MKSLTSLVVLLLSLAHFNPVWAEFQSKNEMNTSAVSTVEEKIYIPHDKLYFSDEGIFLLLKSDQWASVHQLGYDTNGYYLAGSRLVPGIASFIATCNYCRSAYYNRAPQPCDTCGREDGMDIQYEDYWDRRG